MLPSIAIENPVIAIPAFTDNYIWVIVANSHCVVVDPGDAAPVLIFLEAHKLTLDAILITHHHADHTNGIAALTARYPVPVYGPANEPINGITHLLREGENIIPSSHFCMQPLRVLEVPGHTRGHIAYVNDHWLFCGDTLFSAGCGRLLEGTAQQMYQSLQRLAALPDATAVYCAHEYTLLNLRFAQTVEPQNESLLQRDSGARALRRQGLATLPSSIALEKATNPFLRCMESTVIEAVQHHIGSVATEAQSLSHEAVFAALRDWKDHFHV